MLLGFKPPLAQSWVMSSTLILSLGAAITLRSLRVFDLDDWALQLLLIWGAGVGVLACFQLIRSNGWVNEAVAMLASFIARFFSPPLYTALADLRLRQLEQSGPPKAGIGGRSEAVETAPDNIPEKKPFAKEASETSFPAAASSSMEDMPPVNPPTTVPTIILPMTYSHKSPPSSLRLTGLSSQYAKRFLSQCVLSGEVATTSAVSALTNRPQVGL